MLAAARPNVTKLNTKIEYWISSVRAGVTAPIAIGDQHNLSRLVGSRKHWTLAVIVRRHNPLTKDDQLKRLKMGRIIAGINMTLDGICDHTAGIPDEELLQHYADLLSNVDTVLYGRITYQLMKYWKVVAENPTGEKAKDEFAVIMNKIPKIVFSHTLKNADWDSAKLANRDLEEEVLELKQQSGKEILIGSRSLIIQLMKLNLIDEFQLCVHPVVEGSGLPLFENITDRTVFKLTKTKTFGGGAVTLYYEPTKKTTNH